MTATPRWGVALVGLALAACAQRTAATPPRHPSGSTPAQALSVDWPQVGGDLEGQHFSPMRALDPTNVARLVQRFSVPLGPAGTPEEAYPLEVGGVLYLDTTGDTVLAVDATTGRVLWRYTPGPLHPPAWAPLISRGVAVLGNRVFLLTADDHLVALDRASGEPLWSVSVADPRQAYFGSMAPLAVDGRVFVGGSGGDEGARGFLAAYDASTGARLWQLYTVPADGQGWMAALGFHGGGTVWTTPVYDPSTDTLYAGTGNPSPDYFGATRPGPDLYTDCVLAVDASRGTLLWASQEVPHDLWDYDAASPPLLFPLTQGTGVGEAGKDGYWYPYNAASGTALDQPVAFVKEGHSPPTPSGTLEWPGPDGGANYGPSAYDPGRHLVFVAGINGPEKLLGAPTQHAQNTPDFGTGQQGVPGAHWTGTITAIDVRSDRIVWQVATPSPPIGGVLATAGGLVVFGQENGLLEALDAQTGDQVWQQRQQAPIGTAPLAYRVDGVTYLAVVTGGAASLQGLFPSQAPGVLQVWSLPPAGTTSH